jgi:hypothetical protein
MVQIRCLCILMLLFLGAAKSENVLIRHLRKANEYVLTHTRYHTHRLPKIVWLTIAEMAKLSDKDDELCQDNSDFVTDAMEDNGVMYLTKGEFKLGHDDQILVHELVHFQQETNPNSLRDIGVLEKEAYAVETRYVKDTHRGVLPDPVMVSTISKQDCTQ